MQRYSFTIFLLAPSWIFKQVIQNCQLFTVGQKCMGASIRSKSLELQTAVVACNCKPADYGKS
jgi:hypothetical protein